MRTLKLKLIHLPYGLAVVLALVGVGLAARANQNLSQSPGIHTEVEIDGDTAEPKVTINGEEVDLGSDGEGTFRRNGATIEVDDDSTNVTSDGGRTVITNDDGTVDIHVESNSSDGSSETKVRYRGNSSYEYDNDSSVRVEQSN